MGSCWRLSPGAGSPDKSSRVPEGLLEASSCFLLGPVLREREQVEGAQTLGGETPSDGVKAHEGCGLTTAAGDVDTGGLP